jgi:hypothetical protein
LCSNVNDIIESIKNLYKEKILNIKSASKGQGQSDQKILINIILGVFNTLVGCIDSNISNIFVNIKKIEDDMMDIEAYKTKIGVSVVKDENGNITKQTIHDSTSKKSKNITDADIIQKYNTYKSEQIDESIRKTVSGILSLSSCTSPTFIEQDKSRISDILKTFFTEILINIYNIKKLYKEYIDIKPYLIIDKSIYTSTQTELTEQNNLYTIVNDDLINVDTIILNYNGNVIKKYTSFSANEVLYNSYIEKIKGFLLKRIDMITQIQAIKKEIIENNNEIYIYNNKIQIRLQTTCKNIITNKKNYCYIIYRQINTLMSLR